MIAAFLDQPIVPVGHHDTLADGPELLTQVAATINSLGTSLGKIRNRSWKQITPRHSPARVYGCAGTPLHSDLKFPTESPRSRSNRRSESN